MQFYSDEQYDEFQRDLGGDGHHNEYSRAFEHSRMRQEPMKDERALAARLHAAGRVVVCGEWEVCCPITDGLIGYDWVVLRDFATEAEALAYAGQGEDRPDGIFIYVPPKASGPQTPIDDDGQIPF